MNTIQATYQIDFHEVDSPVAINHYGCWSAVGDISNLKLNVLNPEAFLVFCTITSICHPDLGPIRGLYPVGLDYTIVLADYSQIKMEAEERSGFLYDLKKTLTPSWFDIEIWQPKLTPIPANHSYAGLTQAESKMIWENRLKEVRRKLRISDVN